MKKKTTNKRPGAKTRATKSESEDLFSQVIKLTGIPAKTIRHELKTILERKNIDVNHLTLDQLRAVVASYLREIMTSVLDRTKPDKPETTHH